MLLLWDGVLLVKIVLKIRPASLAATNWTHEKNTPESKKRKGKKEEKV